MEVESRLVIMMETDAAMYFWRLCRAKNKLFRNLGHWKFKETTREAGLDRVIPYSSGAVFEDIDGDGWLDLIISTFGSGVRTYLKLGQQSLQVAWESRIGISFRKCHPRSGRWGRGWGH